MNGFDIAFLVFLSPMVLVFAAMVIAGIVGAVWFMSTNTKRIARRGVKLIKENPDLPTLSQVRSKMVNLYQNVKFHVKQDWPGYVVLAYFVLLLATTHLATNFGVAFLDQR